MTNVASIRGPEPRRILENGCMKLWYHEHGGIVHHQILCELESSEFREALMRGAQLLEETGVHKWLSDDRAHSVLHEADEEWARTTWFPRVKAAGWTHWAILKPQSAIATLNIARVSSHFAKLGVETRILSDFDAALEWLESLD